MVQQTFPCSQPLEKTTVEQVSTLQCVEDPTVEQMDIPQGSCSCGEAMQEQEKSVRSEWERRVGMD